MQSRYIIISLIANANNCMTLFLSSKVYARLQKLNVSISHMTLLRLLSSIGNKFDESVIEWQESFLPILKASMVRKIIVVFVNNVII